MMSAYLWSQHFRRAIGCPKMRSNTIEGNARDTVKDRHYIIGERDIPGYGIPQYRRFSSPAHLRVGGTLTRADPHFAGLP